MVSESEFYIEASIRTVGLDILQANRLSCKNILMKFYYSNSAQSLS